jgi:hypothetical protein
MINWCSTGNAMVHIGFRTAAVVPSAGLPQDSRKIADNSGRPPVVETNGCR